MKLRERFAKYLVPAITVLTGLFYFFVFEGIGLDYWDTYIAVPATFVAGKPCTIVDAGGQPAYEYRLQNRLPQDLAGKGTTGIISRDQRIGAGVTFAPAYLAFGVIGFRLLYAVFGALAFWLSVVAGRRLFQREWQAVLLGFLVALNPFMFSMNRLNANFIAVPILMGLLALLLAEKPQWLIAGLVFGALGGIRNEAIVMAPSLGLLMFSTRAGRRGILWFGAGALATIAPYLAWNKFAFGKALIHASQYSDFEGYRPMFEHSFLGATFQLNGLFNWPFYDHLVRTPHYPFPTYVTLPLVFVLCFGVLFSALGVAGFFAQFRREWRVSGFLALWFIATFGLFVFQENWEEPKTTFAALSIIPLAIFMVRGVQWLIGAPRDWRRWATVVALVLAIEGGVHLAGTMRAPLDERWYVRFPKAKTEAAGIGCLTDEQRREWMFFHTDECPAELAEQRAKLTRGNLLPHLYYPVRLYPPTAADWGRYNPDIFDIWEKIYGF